MPNSWQTSLRQLLSRSKTETNQRIALVGIGNTFRSDDAAGIHIARGLLHSRLVLDLEHILVIDAGHAPENSTAELRRFAPQVVLFIDAADMGEQPGSLRFIGMDEMDGMSASTHTMPLSMLAGFLRLDLGCDVKLLGIQPESNDVGETLSLPVQQAVDDVIAAICDSLTS